MLDTQIVKGKSKAGNDYYYVLVSIKGVEICRYFLTKKDISVLKALGVKL